MPSYAQAAEIACEIRASSPRVAFEMAKNITFQRSERDLRELLEDDILTLISHLVGEPDPPRKIPGPLIPNLVIDFDGDRVQFPDGTLYYGCRVYSTAAWEARSKESAAPPVREPAATESVTKSTSSSKRGPKGYDTWELFKARLYLDLYDEDVKAFDNIDIEERADQLMLWGQNHPHIGASKTPKQAAMRAKIAEWIQLWPLIRQAVDRGSAKKRRAK
jgi:hypothetical protein